MGNTVLDLKIIFMFQHLLMNQKIYKKRLIHNIHQDYKI